jgi:hypothetical protein
MGHARPVAGAHAFGDESKRNGYTLAVVLCPPDALDQVRGSLRCLLLRGQRRLHFKHESNARRKQIVDVLAASGIEAAVYQSASRRDAAGRHAVLGHLVPGLLGWGVAKLVLERDESIVRADRQRIHDLVSSHKAHGLLQWDLLAAHEDPMLWAADAVAWCWAKGGPWRASVMPMVGDRRYRA